jgi:uncharacterized protein
MDYSILIQSIKDKIKSEFASEATGHDWHHIFRVYSNACFIQEKEGGDRLIVELAALLHDISDHKFNGGKLNEGGEIAFQLLIDHGCEVEIANKIKNIIDNVSYKGANVLENKLSIEGQIVQDADRLDALGAIGIARAFAFGGNRNRPIYEPSFTPTLHNSFEEYANSKSHTINHFYEKLLLLRDRLHTDTAKIMGEERHKYMEQFLEQFYKEWNINEKLV